MEKLEPQVIKALEALVNCLSQNEVVLHYQKLDRQVQKNQEIKDLEEKIKYYQKETVNFAHYGKMNAAKEAKEKADALTNQFNEHPLVVSYRKALYETNDLLQYVTGEIEVAINEEVE